MQHALQNTDLLLSSLYTSDDKRGRALCRLTAEHIQRDAYNSYDTQQKYAIVNSDIYDRAKLIDRSNNEGLAREKFGIILRRSTKVFSRALSYESLGRENFERF